MSYPQAASRRENVLERLDEYHRDLEQELADVSELLRRLRPGEEPRQEPSQPQTA